MQFFASDPSSDSSRRLLLISYFFTPINVVASHRWQAMISDGAERGWSADVIMVDPTCAMSIDPASAMAVDLEKLHQLPDGVTIYQVPDERSWQFRAQQALWRFLRPLVRRTPRVPRLEHDSGPPSEVPRGFRLREAYLSRLHYVEFQRWARAAAKEAFEVAERHIPDAIVSSGPPHSAHEAARRLASQLGRPWIMDLRDPWGALENMPSTHAGRTWMELTRAFESRCVHAATRVVLNTEASRQDMCRRYPELVDRFVTVMNGADPLDVPVVAPARRFTMAYTGQIYVGRDPGTLFRALARVVEQLSIAPEQLVVEFMGGDDYARRAVVEAAERAGVAAFVSFLPRQPHREALKLLARASMLVSLPQYARLAIPAKLFEYVEFDAWLLILAEPGTATEVLFRDSGADVVHPDDVDSIAASIRRRYEQFSRGERPPSLNAAGSFARSRQMRIFFETLDALVPPHTRAMANTLAAGRPVT